MTGIAPQNTNADVRMKGFTSRTTVEAATAWIDSVASTLTRESERVALNDAAGRVLAEDLVSRLNVPAFARSMMDGFALRADETHGASSYNALSFEIIGTCLPGVPFSGRVEKRQAIRIMTGAPVPDGADAVLPAEYCETQGHTLVAMSDVSCGKHIGAIGEDVRSGDVILNTGRVLRPQDLGVISSVGIATIAVQRRPRVRILITGNELLPAGSVPAGFQIADANGPMLSALVTRDGGTPEFAGNADSSIIRDDPDTLLAAMQEPADILLISGGSSVGQEDHAPRLLARHGELAIHGLAMRPSSPAGMGRHNNALVFLLPGNPVSCLCAYDFFAGRAIRILGGRSAEWPYRRVQATLTRKLVSTVGRVDYARVKLDGLNAEPLAISGASVLSSTTQADGFVVVPADREGYGTGTEIDVFLY